MPSDQDLPHDHSDTAESPSLAIAEADSSTDVDPRFVLTNRREILAVLRGLVNARALVSARIMPGGENFVTAVLEVDDDGNVLIDGGPDNALNTRIERAERVHCQTHLDKVRISFALEGLRRDMDSSDVGFWADPPTQLMRLQRREYYRLQIPLADKVVCVVPVPIEGEDGRTRNVDLRILDISGGGVALAAPGDSFEFAEGMSFAGCTLMLPDTAPISTRLTVRNVFKIHKRNGAESLRAGCEFSELSRHADDAIQRYVLRVERERSARARGAL